MGQGAEHLPGQHGQGEVDAGKPVAIRSQGSADPTGAAAQFQNGAGVGGQVGAIKGEILAKIPGGSLVDTGECSEGWCEITWQDKKGFAIQSALDMSGRVPPQRAARPPAYRGRVYSNEPDYVEVPPEIYYEPGPYYYGPYYRRFWGWRW